MRRKVLETRFRLIHKAQEMAQEQQVKVLDQIRKDKGPKTMQTEEEIRAFEYPKPGRIIALSSTVRTPMKSKISWIIVPPCFGKETFRATGKRKTALSNILVDAG